MGISQYVMPLGLRTVELLLYLSVVAVNHLPEVDAETRSGHFPAVVFEFTPKLFESLFSALGIYSMDL